MKLNWFSPLPPAATDIAHYTGRILPALSAVAEVTLWTTKGRWLPSLEQLAEVRRYGLDRPPWTELNRADMTVYNIGNNPKFHWPIWHVSRVHPGIIVLHDFRLHHLFDWVYRCHHQNLNLYLETMEAHYGKEARTDARHCFTSNAANIDYMAERYPLTELALKNALGVLVHTEDALKAVDVKPGRPTALAPLPFPAKEVSLNRAKSPPYRLIIFGYLGRNRRLESVLKALAEFPEKSKFRLDIFGSLLDGEEQIREQIKALKLSPFVTLHGFVNEAQLEAALNRAHLAINLRNPSVGEASGTQLRLWAHALPSLVSSVGWYARLPPAAVRFVRTGTAEVSDLQRCLREFLSNPAEFAAMGLKGLETLQQHHTPENYASKVLALVNQAKQYRIQCAAENLAMRAGTPITEWVGPPDLDERLQHVVGKAWVLLKG